MRCVTQILSMLILTAASWPSIAQEQPLRIFTAKSIITMDPTLPEASAVAVRDGRIVAVGKLDEFDAWTSKADAIVDRRFEDKVILPGFIDNHLHPLLAAITLNTEWITPHSWQLDGFESKKARTPQAYMKQLKDAVHQKAEGEAPFMSWGYHASWHGHLARQALDEVSAERPIIIIQRSFHEIIMNTAALEWLELNKPSIDALPDIELDAGLFSEKGVDYALNRLVPYFFAPERLDRGLSIMRDIIHKAGITTVGDMGVGGYLGLQEEAALFTDRYGGEDTPFRLFLVASPPLMLTQPTKADVDAFSGLDTGKVFSGKHIKFFADGGFFALNMKLNSPGYTDGREGKWAMEPERLENAIRPYWQDGYQIHVHVNGDAAMDAVLDMLTELLGGKPRYDHRFTLHHVGIITTAQVRRAARLNVVISAQPHYLWALSDKYAEEGLGYERASQIARLGSMVRSGIPVSLHSDFSMAPASPLWSAWIAVNRLTANGTVMAPNERLQVYEALRTITIDAAFAIGIEDETGSIVAGKRADFTILAENPLTVSPDTLKDIKVWGTVFEGRPYLVR